MNPTDIKNTLARKIEIKKASENLRTLKSESPTNIMPIKFTNPFMAKNAKLAAENQKLKAESLAKNNLGMVTNSAGQDIIPVTRRNSSGQLITENLTPEQAMAHSREIAGRKPAAKAPAPVRNTAPSKPSSTTSKLTTAAEFAALPLVMARSEFSKLSPADRTAFVKQGGKLEN